jgi:hypothetical protein
MPVVVTLLALITLGDRKQKEAALICAMKPIGVKASRVNLATVVRILEM